MSRPAAANKPPAAAGAASTGYEVARPRGQCVVCQAAVEPGAPLMAALKETPLGFERQDVCLSCWPDFAAKAAAAAPAAAQTPDAKPDAQIPALVGFWKTTMPRHEQKKKVFVDDEVLCQLLERLADATEPAKLNFRFVLALILMRKRLIIYESSRIEDTREIWQVRFRGKEAIMDLLNPKLEEAQIQDVSNQLGEILNEEL